MKIQFHKNFHRNKIHSSLGKQGTQFGAQNHVFSHSGSILWSWNTKTQVLGCALVNQTEGNLPSPPKSRHLWFLDMSPGSLVHAFLCILPPLQEQDLSQLFNVIFTEAEICVYTLISH